MSVYLIATLQVKASGFAQFSQAMAEIALIVEGAGWRLADAYRLRTGRLNTVIDVWEMADLNQMDVGMRAIGQSPRAAEIGAVLAETVIEETLSFADRLIYPGLEGRWG